jgi:hypothetical protein
MRTRAALLCAILVGVVGCGSSSKPLTRSQLTAKANAICSVSNRYFRKIGGSSDTTTKGYAIFLPKLLSRLKAEQSAVKALNAGSAEKADVAAYVNNEGQVISLTEKALTSAKADNASEMHSALQATATPGKAVLGAARRLGWTTCAKTAG